MSLNNRFQVRLSDGLLEHVENRASKMELTPSAFIRYLIIKDQESVGDDRGFWKDAVDKQISEMSTRIVELQQVRKELDDAD